MISDCLNFYVPYLSRVLKEAKVSQGIQDRDYSQVDLDKIRLPELNGEWDDVLISDAKYNIERIARNRGKHVALKDDMERMLEVIDNRPSDAVFGAIGRADEIPTNSKREQNNAKSNSGKVSRRR
jgi:hypothetical protein